jgi:hypothetical protein
MNDTAYVAEAFINLGMDVPFDISARSVRVDGGGIGYVIVHEIIGRCNQGGSAVARHDKLRRIGR